MQLFYAPYLDLKDPCLSPEESKHCIKVLRYVQGSQMHLTDGEGNLHLAEIIEANPKKCQIKIIESHSNFERRTYYLHLAIAPTKSIDRYEWFLEKAVEIGVDEITPLLCTHSERKVVKPERQEKVLVAAMKQSLKAYKPKLNALISFENFIKGMQQVDFKGIAHCMDLSSQELSSIDLCKKSSLILIGPEGDFTQQEIENANIHGFQNIKLGKSRLRTETAGLVACHTTYLQNIQD